MGLKKRRESRGEEKYFLCPPCPSPLVLFRYQDGDRDQCTSEFPLKNTPALKGTDVGVIVSGIEVN